ncbi:uncharacterized protein [Montipora foliosa]|uniref:uncharacterized protein isoform X1 n=1 Tax=Montipora foliosa TaxID=591990 RepID=UPI0035F1DD7D
MKGLFPTILIFIAAARARKNHSEFLGTKVHIRLRSSSLAYAGRVEISKDGENWGTICDQDWDLNDALVICRQLTYSFAEAAVPMAGFGKGSGSIFIRDIDCKGSESTILQCKHDSWESHDINKSCDHSMDVGVLCSPPNKMFSTTLLITVLVCGMALSYILNIWLTYYICCKTKRRRKRHLTLVQQNKALARRTASQGRLENLAFEHDLDENNSQPGNQEDPGQKGIDDIPPKKASQVQHAPNSDNAGWQEEEEEEEPHVYQRIDSCLSNPPITNCSLISETDGHRPTVKQPITQTPPKSTYQPLSPQLRAKTKNDKKGDNQQNINLYQQLQLKNEESQSSSAMDDNGNSFPDYIEIISDEDFANITKKTTTPLFETEVTKTTPNESFKPAPGSKTQLKHNQRALATVVEHHQAPEENDEPDYLEPVDDVWIATTTEISLTLH